MLTIGPYFIINPRGLPSSCLHIVFNEDDSVSALQTISVDDLVSNRAWTTWQEAPTKFSVYDPESSTIKCLVIKEGKAYLFPCNKVYQDGIDATRKRIAENTNEEEVDQAKIRIMMLLRKRLPHRGLCFSEKEWTPGNFAYGQFGLEAEDNPLIDEALNNQFSIWNALFTAYQIANPVIDWEIEKRKPVYYLQAESKLSGFQKTIINQFLFPYIESLKQATSNKEEYLIALSAVVSGRLENLSALGKKVQQRALMLFAKLSPVCINDLGPVVFYHEEQTPVLIHSIKIPDIYLHMVNVLVTELDLYQCVPTEKTYLQGYHLVCKMGEYKGSEFEFALFMTLAEEGYSEQLSLFGTILRQDPHFYSSAHYQQLHDIILTSLSDAAKARMASHGFELERNEYQRRAVRYALIADMKKLVEIDVGDWDISAIRSALSKWIVKRDISSEMQVEIMPIFYMLPVLDARKALVFKNVVFHHLPIRGFTASHPAILRCIAPNHFSIMEDLILDRPSKEYHFIHYCITPEQKLAFFNLLKNYTNFSSEAELFSYIYFHVYSSLPSPTCMQFVVDMYPHIASIVFSTKELAKLLSFPNKEYLSEAAKVLIKIVRPLLQRYLRSADDYVAFLQVVIEKHPTREDIARFFKYIPEEQLAIFKDEQQVVYILNNLDLPQAAVFYEYISNSSYLELQDDVRLVKLLMVFLKRFMTGISPTSNAEERVRMHTSLSNLLSRICNDPFTYVKLDSVFTTNEIDFNTLFADYNEDEIAFNSRHLCLYNPMLIDSIFAKPLSGLRLVAACASAKLFLFGATELEDYIGWDDLNSKRNYFLGNIATESLERILAVMKPTVLKFFLSLPDHGGECFGEALRRLAGQNARVISNQRKENLRVLFTFMQTYFADLITTPEIYCAYVTRLNGSLFCEGRELLDNTLLDLATVPLQTRYNSLVAHVDLDHLHKDNALMMLEQIKANIAHLFANYVLSRAGALYTTLLNRKYKIQASALYRLLNHKSLYMMRQMNTLTDLRDEICHIRGVLVSHYIQAKTQSSSEELHRDSYARRIKLAVHWLDEFSKRLQPAFDNSQRQNLDSVLNECIKKPVMLKSNQKNGYA